MSKLKMITTQVLLLAFLDYNEILMGVEVLPLDRPNEEIDEVDGICED